MTDDTDIRTVIDRWIQAIRERDIDGVIAAVIAVAAAIVLIPGAPLIQLLFLTQALNAVLLLVLLPFLRRLGRDRELMGDHALGRPGRIATGLALALIAASVAALAVLTIV